MVDISIVDGGYKLTYNWGVPHCIETPYIGIMGYGCRLREDDDKNGASSWENPAGFSVASHA